MATLDFDAILREAQMLPPDEQRRLAHALRPPQNARVIDANSLKTLLAEGLGQSRPLTPAEQAAIDAWLARTEELATGISAAWNGHEHQCRRGCA